MKIKKPSNQTITTALVAVLTVATLIYAGMKIQETRTPERLPANQACLALAEKLPVHLQANINLQFGTPLPEETPTKDDIEKLKTDCKNNESKYEIVVAK